MRGKLDRNEYKKIYNRITPAGAGKTPKIDANCTVSEDHPRRCGENHASISTPDVVPGSPPQVRGKRRAEILIKIKHGITPAGAGKTSLHVYAHGFYWDHPRRCGENVILFCESLIGVGSPPQVRGKLYRAAGIAEKYRITPAGAGKTFVFSSRRQQQQDHPRRCGENCSRHTRHLSRSGSPPQVRGKLHPTEGTLSAFRITPAGAGKTCRYCCLGCRAQDHPRRCGENEGGYTVHYTSIRITPAGAGKTSHEPRYISKR